MTEVKVFGRLAGFVLGFGVTLLGLLALNMLYRGVWMPLALVGALGALFSWHPRLSRAPGSPWFIAFFGLIGTAIWMLGVGLSPVRLLQTMALAMPGLFVVLALFVFVVFLRRNLAAEKTQVLYLPIALMLCVLGWTVIRFSGGKGGADPMVEFVMSTLSLSEETARNLVIAFRKSIHFIGYGLVAWSAYRLANPKFDVKAAAIFGFGVAFSVSLFDEFHQSLATNRTGSVWDVGLDMLGALTFLTVSVLRYRQKSQRPGTGDRLLA